MGAKRRECLTLEEEVVEGFTEWVGVLWLEMSREMIPERRNTWVEASIVALNVRTVLAQGVGQKRCSVNVRCPVQPHRGCGLGVGAVCVPLLVSTR